ncbi:MAG: beta-ketoacyl-ACP synthase 3 [Eubacteriales bacterium]
MAGIKIVGYGLAHGAHKVTNDDLKKYVDTNDEWIQSKTGIQSRYFTEDESNVDMAVAAAKKAFAMQPEGIKIDAIIVATFTPDNAAPSVAAEVAGRLGLSGTIMSFDMNGACAGFVYGLTVSNALIQAGYERILLIGSEKIHPLMDMKDRNTCVLFGDAAGALLLEKDETGIFYHTEGLEANREILECARFNPAIKMSGQEVYRFAVSKIPECAYELLEKTEKTIEDVDMFVFHQANLRIIDSAARKLKIPKEKNFVNVQKYGNTSAASVAVAMSECLEKGLIKNGNKIVAVGFGAGLSYGGVLMSI